MAGIITLKDIPKEDFDREIYRNTWLRILRQKLEALGDRREDFEGVAIWCAKPTWKWLTLSWMRPNAIREDDWHCRAFLVGF